jgi:hypothetical protein
VVVYLAIDNGESLTLRSLAEQYELLEKRRMNVDLSTHSAGSTALGYLYQCRYALLLGLQALTDSPQLRISIEKFDDIAFDDGDDPVTVIQTKHHLTKPGNLTNASVDLWKTLGIWMEVLAQNAEAPFRARFIIVTTGAAPDGHATALLRARDRNESRADEILLKTANESSSDANAEAYARYRKLPEGLRLALLKAVYVLDASPNVLDVLDDIGRELRHAVPRHQVGLLVERLEGWWFGVVIRSLCEGSRSVPVATIEARIDELRDGFQRDALPVDYADRTPPATVVAELDGRAFVRQLRCISVGERRVEFAIRDFYRASEQRSKWARQELLVDGEIEHYERRLREAWEPRHATMLDSIPDGADENAKASAGEQVFRWAETEASFPLRTVEERFLTHGSFHILANRRVIGWHPEFRTLIADVNGDKPKGKS